jgi:hypothetical protein
LSLFISVVSNSYSAMANGVDNVFQVHLASYLDSLDRLHRCEGMDSLVARVMLTMIIAAVTSRSKPGPSAFPAAELCLDLFNPCSSV